MPEHSKCNTLTALDDAYARITTAVAAGPRPVPLTTRTDLTTRPSRVAVVTRARIDAARLEAGIREARLRLPGRSEDIYVAVVKATLADAEVVAGRSHTEAAIIGAADDAEQALLKGWLR